MSLYLTMSGSFLVRRGGCWGIVPQFARVAHRGSYTPDARINYLGVRLTRRHS